MKRIIVYSLFLIIYPIYTLETKQKEEPCDLDICAEWKNLDAQEEKYTQKFGGTWILAGTFTFRNRSSDVVPLKELDLVWKGKQEIGDLEGSLFKKAPHRPFIPVEQFLVADGHWNKDQQILQLKFNEKEYLGVSTTFYLVLTVSPTLEKKLKDGYFTVLLDTLPLQLKKTVQKRRPILSISPSHTSKARKHRLAYGVKRK